jgi:hypothetical protein
VGDGWTVNDEYTRGYDKALSEVKPEIDRLRAENAEMRYLLAHAYPIVEDETSPETDWCQRCRTILRLNP